MQVCYFCGIESSDLKECPYCKQNYCGLHYETNMHDCPLTPIESPYKLDLGAENQPMNIDNIVSGPTIAPIHQSHINADTNSLNIIDDDVEVFTDGTYMWYKKEKGQVPEDAFNPESGVVIPGILWPKLSEFKHILIAAILMFALAATGFIPQYDRVTGISLSEKILSIVVLSSIYVIAFLGHEFSHRQTAKHFKLQTKFRLFKWGIVLTLVCLILPLKFALPGAVVVIGLENISRETGLCKLAGPLFNLIMGLILLGLTFLPFILYPWNFLFLVGASFNFMLGAFNMLPFGILDGDNIRKWKPKLWIVLFIVLVGLLILVLILMNNSNVITALSLRGKTI